MLFEDNSGKIANWRASFWLLPPLARKVSEKMFPINGTDDVALTTELSSLESYLHRDLALRTCALPRSSQQLPRPRQNACISRLEYWQYSKLNNIEIAKWQQLVINPKVFASWCYDTAQIGAGEVVAVFIPVIYVGVLVLIA